MPVDTHRHGGAEGMPRLPGDDGTPKPWECPQCEAPQSGRLEDGCVNCGSGKPGYKATEPQPQYVEGVGRVVPGVLQREYPVRGQDVPSLHSSTDPRRGPGPGGIADRILARPVADTPALLDAIRMVLREELTKVGQELVAAQGRPAFTPQQRYALSEGIRVVQTFVGGGEATEQELALLPSAEELVQLYAWLTEEQT